MIRSNIWVSSIDNFLHYSDVIMGTIASQITSITIVYSIIYSNADKKNHQRSASLAFVRGIHRGFPAQMASNAENVSIWWRHHEWCPLVPLALWFLLHALHSYISVNMQCILQSAPQIAQFNMTQWTVSSNIMIQPCEHGLMCHNRAGISPMLAASGRYRPGSDPLLQANLDSSEIMHAILWACGM